MSWELSPTGFSLDLQKTIQQLAAALIQLLSIPNQEVDAVAIGDKQGRVVQAPNIIFALEY